jgi:Mce-associated membrane protein
MRISITLRRPHQEDRPRQLRRPRRLVLGLTAGLVLVLAGAGFAWYHTSQLQRQQADTKSCLAAATAAAQAIFSYDYRNFDASVANAKPFVTGNFAKEYAQTTASLKATAQKEQAVVQAQVSAVGVVQATGGHIELLVYLNQYRRNTNVSGEKVDQNRVVLTMTKAGHTWKVTQASAI